MKVHPKITISKTMKKTSKNEFIVSVLVIHY